MTIGRRRTLLGSAGVAAVIGLVTFMLAGSMDWGPPGTLAYVEYERASRVIGLPWLAVAIVLAVLLRWPPKLGVAIALLGASLAFLGSVSEFWLLTDVPYTDPLRGASFSIFLLGHPLFLAGYAIAWRQARGDDERPLLVD